MNIKEIRLNILKDDIIQNSYGTQSSELLSIISYLIFQRLEDSKRNNFEECAKTRHQEWEVINNYFNLSQFKLIGPKGSYSMDGILFYIISKVNKFQ